MESKIINQNPKIIMFACEKWGYAAADLTGTCRKQYSSDIYIIRVKCTGRVSLDIIIESLLNGADGVAVIGWHEHECEFGDGNMNTYKHIKFLKKLFKHIGISENRVEYYFVSAAEVENFLNATTDIIEKLKKLPPLLKKIWIEWPL